MTEDIEVDCPDEDEDDKLRVTPQIKEIMSIKTAMAEIYLASSSASIKELLELSKEIQKEFFNHKEKKQESYYG